MLGRHVKRGHPVGWASVARAPSVSSSSSSSSGSYEEDNNNNNILLNQHVIKIAAATGDGFHSLCLTKSGRVFAFGANSVGQCGRMPRGYQYEEQQHDDNDNNVGGEEEEEGGGGDEENGAPVPVNGEVDAAADAVVPIDGAVPAPVPPAAAPPADGDGNNDDDGDDDGELPIHVVSVRGLETVRCIAIAAGWEFSAAVDDHGGVWTWGRDAIQDDETKHQLGHYPRAPSTSMMLGHRSVADKLKESDDLHNLDLNERRSFAQLCREKGSDNEYVAGTGAGGCPGIWMAMPCVVLSHVYVTRVSLGDGFTVALTRDGAVWTFGRNHQYQLGIGHNISCEGAQLVSFPKKSPLLVLRDTSKDYSEMKTPAIFDATNETSEGQVNNEDKQANEINDEYTSDIVITSIVAGESISYALSNDGRLFTWGGSHNTPYSKRPVELLYPHYSLLHAATTATTIVPSSISTASSTTTTTTGVTIETKAEVSIALPLPSDRLPPHRHNHSNISSLDASIASSVPSYHHIVPGSLSSHGHHLTCMTQSGLVLQWQTFHHGEARLVPSRILQIATSASIAARGPKVAPATGGCCPIPDGDERPSHHMFGLEEWTGYQTSTSTIGHKRVNGHCSSSSSSSSSDQEVDDRRVIVDVLMAVSGNNTWTALIAAPE
jgi:hypothetical protein